MANPSFEESGLLGENTVKCFDLGQFGDNTAATTRTTTAHTGKYGMKLTVSNYVSGDAKILTQQDLGECAPYLKVGQRYKISGWYQSTAPTLFIIYGRNPQGGWEYLTESQLYSASSSWTQATYVTPPLPAGYSGISFGLGLVSNGTLTVDDYGMAAQPSVAAGENMLQNTSLEEATDVEGIPNCWGTGNGGGMNTATWSRTHEAHSGEWAEQVEISSYTSGDEKLVSRQDTGSCAPTAKPGHTYNASAWYESNQPVHLVAYDYIPEGTEKGWHFWAQSNAFPASATYTQAKWTTPAFPANATLISIGASLRAVGKMTVDDFSLSDSDTIPPNVKVTSPASGATVSGTTPIDVEATSTDGEVTQVECLVDGHVIGVSFTAPYSCEWNSTTATEGSHTITARAEDWADNVSESVGVPVTVSNGTEYHNWLLSASLTDKELGQAITLPEGSAFNGSGELNTETGSGAVNGNLSVPPFSAPLELFGILPVSFGTTVSQVGSLEGTVAKSEAVPGDETLGAAVKLNLAITSVGILGLTIPTRCATTKPLALKLVDTLTREELLTKGWSFAGTTTIPKINCEGGFLGEPFGVVLSQLLSGPENPYSLAISAPSG